MFDLPITPIPRDLGKCDAFSRLHEEIVYIKSKIEQASNVLMAFDQTIEK